MSEDIRRCKICGRILIDKNNIIGVCPKHQKGLNDGAVVFGCSVIALGLKKGGLKILKESVKLVKR